MVTIDDLSGFDQIESTATTLGGDVLDGQLEIQEIDSEKNRAILRCLDKVGYSYVKIALIPGSNFVYGTQKYDSEESPSRIFCGKMYDGWGRGGSTRIEGKSKHIGKDREEKFVMEAF